MMASPCSTVAWVPACAGMTFVVEGFAFNRRHSRAGGSPGHGAARVAFQDRWQAFGEVAWVPACAGMTVAMEHVVKSSFPPSGARSGNPAPIVGVCGWVPDSLAGLGFGDDGWRMTGMGFTMGAASGGGTYPRSLRGVSSCAYRCLRRDVGGPIHRPRGNGRRPEGERNGSRSGEARWQPFPVKCQQWRGAGDRPSGSRCDGARPGNGQRAPEAKVVPRDRNRRRGCRKATPGP